MTSELRIGFKASAMILGLLALAYIFTSQLFGRGMLDTLPFQPVSPGISYILLYILQDMAFPLAVIVLLTLVSRPYLPKLWAQPAKLSLMIAFFTLGVLFAVVINHPFHSWLIDTFMDVQQSPLVGFDAMPSADFAVYVAGSLFIVAIVVPISEELTARGALFEELNGLSPIHVAFWSVLMFSFAHYLVFGVFKVIAVIPMAIAYVYIRHRFGSWKYAAATHAGLNAYAVLGDLI